MTIESLCHPSSMVVYGNNVTEDQRKSLLDAKPSVLVLQQLNLEEQQLKNLTDDAIEKNLVCSQH